MKVLIPINQNPVYSEILFRINNKEVYSLEFAKEFKKTQPTIIRQLEYLKEEGYLIKERGKNKQLYSINWNKIEEEFYLTTKGFIKKKREVIDYLDNKINYRKAVKKAFSRKEFIDLFNYLFSQAGITEGITLEKIFLGIVNFFGDLYGKEDKEKVINKIVDHDFILAMWLIYQKLEMDYPEYWLRLHLGIYINHKK